MNTLFWFRKDLRLHANEGLIRAIENGAKDAIFFVCEKQWKDLHGTAPIQVDLIKRRVDYLGQQLADIGITLHVLDASTFTHVPNLLKRFCLEHNFTSVYVNKEHEFYENERDRNVVSAGVNLTSFDGDTLVSPATLVTKKGEMYKVFTPFKKALLARLENTHFHAGTIEFNGNEKACTWLKTSVLDGDGSSIKWPVDDVTIDYVFDKFTSTKLMNYAEHRDYPDIKGTSGLSPYFAIGAVSVKRVLARLQQRYPDILQATKRAEFSWVNELIWREFYRHLLVAYPQLNKYKNFNTKYDKLTWLNNEADFQAWCEGQTGYPIVDAAMRQLNTTGWMHNRLRMIVASFLTKHLLVDWRLGERYFMSKLIDGDLASNNGGWQWAASTGCDAQPYFRVFNPIRQGEQYDPQGEFIRKYVPELADVPNKYIHFPHDYLSVFTDCEYPSAIVDHKEARLRALQAFKLEDV